MLTRCTAGMIAANTLQKFQQDEVAHHHHVIVQQGIKLVALRVLHPRCNNQSRRWWQPAPLTIPHSVQVTLPAHLAAQLADVALASPLCEQTQTTIHGLFFRFVSVGLHDLNDQLFINDNIRSHAHLNVYLQALVYTCRPAHPCSSLRHLFRQRLSQVASPSGRGLKALLCSCNLTEHLRMAKYNPGEGSSCPSRVSASLLPFQKGALPLLHQARDRVQFP